MNDSFLNIVDLPEEILVNIFSKLHNLDVLHSIIGSNRKLDRIARDQTFVQSIDVTSIFARQQDNAIASAVFDRFCSEILPRILDQIQSLTIEICFLECILFANDFVNLHRISLVSVNLEKDLNLFHGLNMHTNHILPTSLLYEQPSTTCSSSTITTLHIKLHNINDCLHLLDGRLPRLHSLLVKLDYIHDPQLLRLAVPSVTEYSFDLLQNTKHLDKLKCFSLCAQHATNEFESLVAPLIHRMIHLENLSLSLRLSERTSFIDCNYLNEFLLKHLPSLQEFHFNFGIDHVFLNEGDVQQSFESIRRTFLENGYEIGGYVFYGYYSGYLVGQCHIYSLPYVIDFLQPLSHSFPGGWFPNVTSVRLRDIHSPFEHDFFLKISQSFPFLRCLIISNEYEQREEPKEVSAMIEFCHLNALHFYSAHLNYVERFLSASNTRLPSLTRLEIQYEDLLAVTENFSRDATRLNCARLKSIQFYDELHMVHSEDFYRYFPSL